MPSKVCSILPIRPARRIRKPSSARGRSARRASRRPAIRALLRRLAFAFVTVATMAIRPLPAAATDWTWLYDDAATHLSYGYDESTIIYKDQRVRVWLKIYETKDPDEAPLDRVYQEVNCASNRVRLLTIQPRLEGEDEDSLPIIPFPAEVAITDRSPEAVLRRAVCAFIKSDPVRSESGRGSRTESRKGAGRPGRILKPASAAPRRPGGAVLRS